MLTDFPKPSIRVSDKIIALSSLTQIFQLYCNYKIRDKIHSKQTYFVQAILK